MKGAEVWRGNQPKQEHEKLRFVPQPHPSHGQRLYLKAGVGFGAVSEGEKRFKARLNDAYTKFTVTEIAVPGRPAQTMESEADSQRSPPQDPVWQPREASVAVGAHLNKK